MPKIVTIISLDQLEPLKGDRWRVVTDIGEVTVTSTVLVSAVKFQSHCIRKLQQLPLVPRDREKWREMINDALDELRQRRAAQ